jgi:hypothetical protein
MDRVFKFVALVLSIALFASPASALSICWSGSGEAQHGCAPDCPMMEQMNSRHAADTMQAIASAPSCCDISSGKPAPTTQLLVPTSSARTPATPPDSSAAFAAVLFPANRAQLDASPVVPTASAQAVLCTYLI